MSARHLVLILGVAACTHQHRGPVATTGAIMGLVRDKATGEPIDMAELRLRADGQLAGGASTQSKEGGLYDFDKLAPGTYALTAYFAGDVVEIANVEVVAGHAAAVDIAFELGRSEPLQVDYGNANDGAIDHYRPPRANPSTGLIEGTVSDTATRERVPGAVVSAISTEVTQTREAVTDDRGRFVFPDLPPGIYAVSAYYTIARRGQIEVLRNNLDVHGGEAVVVPLWIELQGQ